MSVERPAADAAPEGWFAAGVRLRELATDSSGRAPQLATDNPRAVPTSKSCRHERQKRKLPIRPVSHVGQDATWPAAGIARVAATVGATTFRAPSGSVSGTGLSKSCWHERQNRKLPIRRVAQIGQGSAVVLPCSGVKPGTISGSRMIKVVLPGIERGGLRASSPVMGASSRRSGRSMSLAGPSRRHS